VDGVWLISNAVARDNGNQTTYKPWDYTEKPANSSSSRGTPQNRGISVRAIIFSSTRWPRWKRSPIDFWNCSGRIYRKLISPLEYKKSVSSWERQSQIFGEFCCLKAFPDWQSTVFVSGGTKTAKDTGQLSCHGRR
jgi:hypothetical protein